MRALRGRVCPSPSPNPLSGQGPNYPTRQYKYHLLRMREPAKACWALPAELWLHLQPSLVAGVVLSDLGLEGGLSCPRLAAGQRASANRDLCVWECILVYRLISCEQGDDGISHSLRQGVSHFIL